MEYDFRSDIYSVGVVILEMISDVSVSDFMNGKELVDISHITQIILRSILSPDPRKRPTLDEILIMILYKSFLLVSGFCGFDEEKFQRKENKKVHELVEMFTNKYRNTISDCRNDFNHLLMQEDVFFFHFGYIII